MASNPHNSKSSQTTRRLEPPTETSRSPEQAYFQQAYTHIKRIASSLGYLERQQFDSDDLYEVREWALQTGKYMSSCSHPGCRQDLCSQELRQLARFVPRLIESENIEHGHITIPSCIRDATVEDSDAVTWAKEVYEAYDKPNFVFEKSRCELNPGHTLVLAAVICILAPYRHKAEHSDRVSRGLQEDLPVFRTGNQQLIDEMIARRAVADAEIKKWEAEVMQVRKWAEWSWKYEPLGPWES